MKTIDGVEYTISQTHPNRGYIIFPNIVGCEPIKFYVNNQIIPGVASSLSRKYESMGFEASTIEGLVELVSISLYD